MAKKQTRRSISISGNTYQKLRDYCADEECSMSGLIEDLLKELFDMKPANGTRVQKVKELIEVKQNFSF